MFWHFIGYQTRHSNLVLHELNKIFDSRNLKFGPYNIPQTGTNNEFRRLTKLVEKVFTTQFLFQFITSSVIFCVTAYRIALVKKNEFFTRWLKLRTFSFSQMSISSELITFVFYISFCMVMLFEIFLACYFGNEIILRNVRLSFAVYSANWIDLSPRFKKNMIMFVEALKKPTMIKTAKIFTLTLDSFLIVFKFLVVMEPFTEPNLFSRSSIGRTVCLPFSKIHSIEWNEFVRLIFNLSTSMAFCTLDVTGKGILFYAD